MQIARRSHYKCNVGKIKYARHLTDRPESTPTTTKTKSKIKILNELIETHKLAAPTAVVTSKYFNNKIVSVFIRVRNVSISEPTKFNCTDLSRHATLAKLARD